MHQSMKNSWAGGRTVVHLREWGRRYIVIFLNSMIICLQGSGGFGYYEAKHLRFVVPRMRRIV